MSRTLAKILVFTLVVIGAFAYLGQLVPQFVEHPPQKVVITTTTDKADLAEFGKKLVRGKGGCLVCHKDQETGNERGPDLRKAAAQAPSRKPGTAAEDYLIESLKEPGAFVVDGYPNMMPAAVKPPAKMSMAEVKAVVAYLQVLAGGEPSVTILPEDVATAAAATGPVHRGRALMDTHACIACHSVAGEGGAIGPELTTVATRHEPAALLSKIRQPSTWTAEGFPAGVMPVGDAIPEGDLHEIVAYLASLAGKSYSATGATSPWSHEGLRLGLVILIFNLGMLLVLALARRGERARGGASHG